MWKYIRIIVSQWIQRAMNREPETLPDMELELAIQSAIDACIREERMVSFPFRTGNVYAYPIPGSKLGVHWGINGGKYGFCVLQGIEDPERRVSERWETGNPK